MSDQAAANRQQQATLYGQPLSEVVARINHVLGLNQAAVARVLGLSAPMLSHLVAGRRVKIGNPVAHARLGQLLALAESVARGELPESAVPAEIHRIGGAADSWNTGNTATTAAIDSTPVAGDSDLQQVRQLQDLFRQVAGAADWLVVAGRAEPDHPEIAELLRIYAAARTDDAVEHWRRIMKRSSSNSAS